jgi:phosphoglycolate phosphatase-like HAD superfamily hydrolase
MVMEEVISAPFVPGAQEFLISYSAYFPFFIASATPQDELVSIVEQRSLGKYFRGIFGAPRTKAAIIDSILQKQALRPDEVLFVGDALNDYMAAQTCGVPFVGRELEGGTTFAGLTCLKVKDLSLLPHLLLSYPQRKG